MLNLVLSIYHLLFIIFITMEVVEESIKLLIAKFKVVARKTKQCLDFFFIADCQLEPEIINNISCLQKGTRNETVGMSGETPKLSNKKTPSLSGCNIEDFTARAVAIKMLFMNKFMNWSRRQSH